MHKDQTITLSEKVSEQKTGIVLCWTAFDYAQDKVMGYDNNYSFIPKTHVLDRQGSGVAMLLTQPGINALCAKYVYVSDTSIRGNEANDRKSPIQFGHDNNDARLWVLCKVLGV